MIPARNLSSTARNDLPAYINHGYLWDHRMTNIYLLLFLSLSFMIIVYSRSKCSLTSLYFIYVIFILFFFYLNAIKSVIDCLKGLMWHGSITSDCSC